MEQIAQSEFLSSYRAEFNAGQGGVFLRDLRADRRGGAVGADRAGEGGAGGEEWVGIMCIAGRR